MDSNLVKESFYLEGLIYSTTDHNSIESPIQFIPSKEIIVRGEVSNDPRKTKRSAKIYLNNLKNGKLEGNI